MLKFMGFETRFVEILALFMNFTAKSNNLELQDDEMKDDLIPKRLRPVIYSILSFIRLQVTARATDNTFQNNFFPVELVYITLINLLKLKTTQQFVGKIVYKRVKNRNCVACI